MRKHQSYGKAFYNRVGEMVADDVRKESGTDIYPDLETAVRNQGGRSLVSVGDQVWAVSAGNLIRMVKAGYSGCNPEDFALFGVEA
jgi:hypothetical protein